MRWERQIEVADYRRKVFLSIGDILGLVQENLSKDEIEEFAKELIVWVEHQREFNLLE